MASPYLFALHKEIIMRKLGDMDNFRIGGTVVNNLRYADEQLQRLINVVVATREEKGLHLNSAMSFSMVFSTSLTTHTCHINVHGNIMEQV